ncbi:hypothetical protein PUR61_23930 [Streptomyces sp. BE20]|uniref:hypothetical protein n=1 Tax=Streptomyces sp. BE20 TaxID=3002525 RepID=UPI002E79EC00|nr:hypothetical protein [Streptomyces sp. BE20]MEE1825207.1 hypothetical protein [Streptomyces sp. BE20]
MPDAPGPTTGHPHPGTTSCTPVRISPLDHWTGPDATPCWMVTLHTRKPDGCCGTHSFVQWAPTRTQAVTAAALRAQSPTAIRHRRGAHLDLPAPD